MAWFTSDFNAFFKDLAKNNDKAWFDQHRQRYQTQVKQPFEAFVAEAITGCAKVDLAIRITPKDAIFRIHRDIRFSKDKTPYKLYTSAIISPAGRSDLSVPGLYFELGPESVRFFGGAYMPEKAQLHGIRTAIMRDTKGFHKVIGQAAFRQLFGTVRGEANKVLPAEFKAAAKQEPLIANKQFYVTAELPPSRVADPRLLDVLLEHYRAMRPFNAWLAAAMVQA